MTRRRRNWLIVAGVVLGIAGWFGYEVHFFFRKIASEYHTADTIVRVAKFVDANEGRWPRSWDELGAPDYLRDGDVRVDFGADPDRLIDDPQLIYNVITPFSGTYQTFPHSKMYLDDLRWVIAENRGAIERLPVEFRGRRESILIDRLHPR
jgi:hypothetical protein